MAKETTKTTKRQPPPRPELPKYNVSHLAADLKAEPSAIRVLLRKSDLKKTGSAWGWENKSDYDAALKSLKAIQAGSAKAEAKAPAKAPAKETKAPAKASGKKSKA